jgi:dTDP-4-dehydrorhamnose 3,5-epimerase
LDLPLKIVPKRHIDDRGWFSEIFHERRLRQLGITSRFVQQNQSMTKRACSVRGLHFQLPPAAQAKIISVVTGRILDVAVDIRRASPTFGKSISIELSAELGCQLYVPVGFAHGFLTLVDATVVMYSVSDYYAPELEGGLFWADPDLAVPWPVKSHDVIISEKDARLPPLSEFISPFPYDGHPLGALRIAYL